MLRSVTPVFLTVRVIRERCALASHVHVMLGTLTLVMVLPAARVDRASIRLPRARVLAVRVTRESTRLRMVEHLTALTVTGAPTQKVLVYRLVLRVLRVNI